MLEMAFYVLSIVKMHDRYELCDSSMSRIDASALITYVRHSVRRALLDSCLGGRIDKDGHANAKRGHVAWRDTQ